MTDAAEAIRAAADAITQLAADNPQAAHAVAQAAADTLAAVAVAVESQRGGPLTRAVDLFDKATREPGARIARADSRSANLRAMSRLVYLMGQMASDKDTFAMLALLLEIARLSDTLATLREAQHRYHQAEASRTVAAILRQAAATAGRLGPAAPTLAGSDLAEPPLAPARPSVDQQSRKDSRGDRAGR